MSLIVVTCHTRRSSEFPHLRAKRRSPCDARTGSERAWDTEKQSQFCVFENENQEKTSDTENQKEFFVY
jgi:hypothetical protein